MAVVNGPSATVFSMQSPSRYVPLVPQYFGRLLHTEGPFVFSTAGFWLMAMGVNVGFGVSEKNPSLHEINAAMECVITMNSVSRILLNFLT